MNNESIKSILDSITEGLWDWDLKSGKVYLSPRYCELIGLPSDDRGFDISIFKSIVHPEDYARVSRVINEYIQEARGALRIEYRMIAKEGTMMWIERRGRIVEYDENGKPSRMAGTIIDITERKRMEDKLHEQAVLLEKEVAARHKAHDALKIKQEQLEALNDSLEELNESLEERIISAINEIRRKDQMLIQQSRLSAMGEMINNIAHQWRQPLNNIGLLVQNIKYSFEMGELTTEEMNKNVAQAMNVIQHMSGTIDDFRNFFRNDKERKAFSVNQIIHRALNFMLPALENSGIGVEYDEQSEILGLGYPNEYLQALLNIINNSKDILLERKVANPFIIIRSLLDNGCSVLTIRDNGGGIAEDILPKIFDPYFTTKEPGKGTGIGLYMSKSIIENNMGGFLTVSNIDGGVEFRLEIPAG